MTPPLIDTAVVAAVGPCEGGEPGGRIIESIPFGTQPVRTAVQTGNCLNKCSDSVTSGIVFVLT